VSVQTATTTTTTETDAAENMTDGTTESGWRT